MKNPGYSLPFSQHELRQFIFPLTLTAILILAYVLFDSLILSSTPSVWLVLFSLAGILYIMIFDRLIRSSPRFRQYSTRINPITSGIGIGILPYLLPAHLNEVFHILSGLSVLGVAIASGRGSAHTNLAIILIVSLGRYISSFRQSADVLRHLAPFVIYIVLVEAVSRIQETAKLHMHRLETINKVSRQIMMSLDTEQTISILNATIQNALEADSYYIGIVKDGEVHLDLFYDDGEYFNGKRIPMEGTLTGWVIKNQKPLFLPDLRQELNLEGVRNYIIGREKSSLSWMGVPIHSANVSGVIVLASYRPNAFDKADMELLTNLTQQVTLALDNTIRHAQVEEQARLDSLTGVYNHAYFLEKFTKAAEDAKQTNGVISLIMLDIDFFKQYNDTHGHLVGDLILNTLCTSIKQHIKKEDAVGRWGGEEFIIYLAGATGEQATHVAERINATLSGLHMEDREGRIIPVPTVSQGIAVFPEEADEIYKLIDLADRRLYVAKGRGRNQIEPQTGFWKNDRNNPPRSGH